MVKKLFTKGSSTLLRAHGKGGASATTLSFLSAPPPEKSAGGFQQAGKKEGGWGEGIFARLLPFSFRLSKRKAEGGFGWNSAFLLPNQNETSPATCLNTWKTEHHRKILFSLREEKIRRVQNGKSKKYFSVVWRAERAVAGLASLVWFRSGVPFKKGSRKVYNYSTRKEKSKSFGSPRFARQLICIQFWG